MDFKNTHFRAYVYTGFKMGKTVSLLHDELVLVFGESYVPNLRTLQQWVADIKAGTFTLEKGVSSGRPRGTRTSELVNKVDDLLANDPRMSTWDLAELLNIDQKSIHRIVTEDLDLKHVCSVWVPAKLSDKNKKDRVACCKRILSTVNQSQSGVYCVQDEVWVNWDIVKSKQQNKTWIKKNGKRSQVEKPKLTTKKTMLLVAFTCSPARFSVTALPKGATVTGEDMVDFYKATRQRFNNIRHNRIKFSDLILQHDNARPHAAARTQTYLAGTGVTMLPQSPCSPDLNICDRSLFTILQQHCMGQQYADGNELLLDTQHFRGSLSEDMLKLQIDKLRNHCQAVISEAGMYITN